MQGKKKINKKKLLTGCGPTTCSRANSTTNPGPKDPCDNVQTCPSVEPVPPPLVVLPEPDDGQGSMDAWRAMRKRKKEKEEKEKAEKEHAEKEKAPSASKMVVEENVLTDFEEENVEG